ncbi:TPA: hypothetical protein ACH3X1_003014 [Trebouxia sp. C0004]
MHQPTEAEGPEGLRQLMDRFEKRFESPVGMLVYMKKRILALDGKSKKKRKSSSEESSSEEKVAKRTKTAFEQARKVMKSELDNLGFKGIEDYGNMEWGTFMIEHPEVRQYIKTQCKG